MGWIQTHRSGPTGIGKTLEDLLGIPENNLDQPDFGDYELKSGRIDSPTMLTMFTRAPQPAKANTYLREKYGYSSSVYDNDEKVLHSTLSANRFTPIANTGNMLRIHCRPDGIYIESQDVIERYFLVKRSLEKNALRKNIKINLYNAKALTRGTGSNEEFHFIEAYESLVSTMMLLSHYLKLVKSMLIYELVSTIMVKIKERLTIMVLDLEFVK